MLDNRFFFYNKLSNFFDVICFLQWLEVIIWDFFGNLGRKIINGVKDWSEEAQGYYRERLDMNEKLLMQKLEFAQRYKHLAEFAGYKKAAKERGLIQD